MRTETAGVVGEVVREHRRNEAGYVDGEPALGRAEVERRPRRDEEGHVGDVDVGAKAVAVGEHGDGVVEVLRGLRVDRERGQIAEVGAPFERRLGQRVRLVRPDLAAAQEQRLEHVLDPVGAAEDALDLRAAATGAHEGEVA